MAPLEKVPEVVLAGGSLVVGVVALDVDVTDAVVSVDVSGGRSSCCGM